MNNSKTYTRKIGLNRGKPRLWLEGAILLDHGFRKGMTWDAYPIDDGSLHLLASNEGGRRIAGTEARPIIDINSGDLLKGFEGCTVTIEATKYLLKVTKNPA